MSTSPITLAPQTIVGWVAGRPVRVIAGGDGTGDQGGTGTATQTGDGQQAASTGAAAGAASQQQSNAASNGANGNGSAQSGATGTTAPPEWDGKIESLPPAVQKLITDARADAGKARTTAKETAAQEARDELLRKLGLTKDGEPAETPEQLAEKLASRETQLYNLRVETALAKSAKAHGGDEDLVTAVLAHSGQLDDLDPDADDFTSKLDALVKAAVEGNPKLKAAQAAGVSGGQFAGGTGEGKGRPSSLGAAIKASLNA